MKKIIYQAGLMLCFMALAVSCKKKQNVQLKDNVPELDLTQFKAKIDEAFGSSVVGYGWAAYKDGQLVAADGGGWARAKGIDSDPQAFTPYTVSTIFSTTKTITAAAALTALRSNKLPPSTKIVDYLPTRWSKDSSILEHVMTDLLSHKSGMTGTLDGFVQMRDKISTGTDATFGSYVYANINYTLFRVIIPCIIYKPNIDNKVASGDKAAIDACAESYESFVRGLLNANGVPDAYDVNTYYWDGKPKTLYYNYSMYKEGGGGNSLAGAEMFDCHDISGAGGLFMNAVQYAHFIDRLMHSAYFEKDLPLMKSEELGMYDHAGANGTYYWHNGGGGIGSNGRQGGCIWMYFPVNKMSFYIQWNSNSSALPKFERDLVAEIFDECYK